MKAKLLSTLAAFPLAAAALTTGVQSAKAVTFATPPVGGDQLDLSFSVNANIGFVQGPGGENVLNVDFFQPVGATCAFAGLATNNCVTEGPANSSAGPNTGFFSPFNGWVGSILDKVQLNTNGTSTYGSGTTTPAGCINGPGGSNPCTNIAFAALANPFLVYDVRNGNAPFNFGESNDVFFLESASQPVFEQDPNSPADALFSINLFGTIKDENGNTYKSRIVLGATFQNTQFSKILADLEAGKTITTALDAEQDLIVQNVPEPSAMLGLAAVLGAGFFAKKRKDS